MNTKQNERLILDGEKFLPSKQTGAGAGLSSVGAALATAGAGALVLPDVEAVTVEAIRAAGVEAMTIRAALATGERAAGALLRECQGQADLTLADNCARKLGGRMASAGAHVSPESIEDATGAGALALQVWRATGAGADGAAERLGARVAWRAAVLSMAQDRFGESTLSFETITDGDLWAWADLSRESRSERAARYRVERAARGGVLSEPLQIAVGFADGRLTEFGAPQFQVLNLPAGSVVTSRQMQLAKRMARLPVGRGRRGAVIERVTNCCALLLDGFRIEDAAAAAGFNPSGNGRGRQTSTDMFCRACRRLGFKGWQLTARQLDGERAARRAATPDGGVIVGEFVGAEFVAFGELVGAEFKPYSDEFKPREPREFEPLACASDWTAQPVELPARGQVPFTSPDFIGARLPVGALSSERGASWRGWLAARRLARSNGRGRARALAVFNDGKRAAIRRALAAGDGAAGKAAARAIRRARRELVLPVEAVEAGE